MPPRAVRRGSGHPDPATHHHASRSPTQSAGLWRVVSPGGRAGGNRGRVDRCAEREPRADRGRGGDPRRAPGAPRDHRGAHRAAAGDARAAARDAPPLRRVGARRSPTSTARRRATCTSTTATRGARRAWPSSATSTRRSSRRRATPGSATTRCGSGWATSS